MSIQLKQDDMQTTPQTIPTQYYCISTVSYNCVAVILITLKILLPSSGKGTLVPSLHCTCSNVRSNIYPQTWIYTDS